MASQPQVASWLTENGPKELEHLFRAIVFHPSAPILLADNDRHYREASVGASKLLGLPRDKIIGRSLDDFAEPDFKPVISERWRAFLKEGEQQGTLQARGRGRRSAGRRVLSQGKRVAGTPSFGAAGQDHHAPRRACGDGQSSSKANVPAWVQDYALFLLDADGQVVAWYAGAERIYGYKSGEAIGQHVSLLYPAEDTLRAKLR